MTAWRKDLSLVALVLTLALVGGACGQKPWVAEELERLRASGAFIDPVTGQVLDPNTGAPVSGSGTGDSNLAGGSSGTDGTGGTEGTAGTEGKTLTEDGQDPTDPSLPGPDGGPPSGGNATGVTKTSIKIGFHAPLTGAAPVPSDSVNKGKDLYFRANPGAVHGRDVQVILENDQYNPSTAIAVCKKMVQDDKVFLLSGAAGTDQIAACARYAESVAVPYLSAGVTEAGLTTLRTYFATTMTYPDQGPMLARYMANNLGARGEKNAMLWFNTPSFVDAHNAWQSGMKSVGASLDLDLPYGKGSGDQQAIQAVGQLQREQIDNVFVLTSPAWFLRVLIAAKNQGYAPTWTGVGITMTFDTVASAGCRTGTLNGARFFSPFPAWVDSRKYDPGFAAAVQRFHPEENGGDDFMWLSWAFSRVGAELLKQPGKNLTRERFIYFVERAKNVQTGIFPPLNFSPTDHFGSSQVHINQAQCSGSGAGDNRWHTIEDFVSP
ncbi:MAG: ABC transporter substrate-binding protein [Actinomycetota bacterium]|nr:ABC transporter substrate-binding protein [Actinomycetota bacterium]